MKENFNENKEPHPSEKDKKNIFFLWQEEEQNINENKEPPLREGEEEYFYIFSSFLTGKRRRKYHQK